jgi:hypothetical protein
VVLRHDEFARGFVSEAGLAGGRAARDTQFSFDKVFPTLFGPLPLAGDAQLIDFLDGSRLTTASATTSRPVGFVLLSNILRYQEHRASSSPSRYFAHEVDASALTGPWQFRAALSTELDPSVRLQSASLTVQRQINRDIALSLGAARSFTPVRSDSVSAAATWRTRSANISLAASYLSQTRETRLGLQISTGLAFNPLRGRYQTAQPGVTTGGGVAVRVSDSGAGAGVEGVEFRGGGRVAVSDARGEALVSGLGETSHARVQVSLDHIDNAYLVGPAEVIDLVPRPGRTIVVDYAMEVASEVEVIAALRMNGATVRPISALALELLDSRGQVRMAGSTEYDGSVIFEGVRAGVYSVRIEPGQSQRLGLRLTGPLSITVGAKGGLVGPVRVGVERESEGATPLPPAPPPPASRTVEPPDTGAAAAMARNDRDLLGELIRLSLERRLAPPRRRPPIIAPASRRPAPVARTRPAKPARNVA